MQSNTVRNILDKHHNKYPHLGEQLDNISTVYNQKMWFQLTDMLFNYTSERIFKEGEDLIELYDAFIKNLDTRINQLKFAQIAVNVSKQYKDNKEAIAFLGKALEKITESPDPKLYIMCAQAEYMLKESDRIGCGDIIKKVSTELEKLNDVDALVYSLLYKVSALYHKSREEYEEFYRKGLQFLAYTPEKNFTEEEKLHWSIEMGKAVLLGKNIYNFGELLEKNILKSLLTSEHAWLYEILQTFNGGRINEFTSTINKYRTQVENHPVLGKNISLMHQKIRILAFMELIFTKDKSQRNLPFSQIAEVAQVSSEDTELLVMKAMSLGLVKGLIDQVEQSVRVSWVQPRLLDIERIKIVQNRIEKWQNNLEDVLRKLETEGSDLLV